MSPIPPYDPELAPFLALSTLPQPFTMEMVKAVNDNPSLLGVPSIEETLGDRPISHVVRQIPGLEPGDPGITVSIFTAKEGARGPRPCVYWIHGGGMVVSTRFLGIATPLSWIEPTDAVIVCVEYRCAPEVQGAAIVNDCYAGLCWVSEHVKELGIDPERIMIAGASAGGGLAAGTALLSRDRKGPKLCAQLLACPMLDDRNNTTSSKQYSGMGTWSRESNEMAWKQLLGDAAGGDDVSYYASPARAKDLSGLPPTFIDVGSAETFRDEDVAYATKLWAAGVQADLHVYGGGFHGYDGFAPNSRLAVQTSVARLDWLKMTFGSRENK